MLNSRVPILQELFYFIRFLFTYLFSKIIFLFQSLLHVFVILGRGGSFIKQRVTMKLVWRRGSLIRPVSHFGLITFASLILVFGGMFTSSRVAGQEVKEIIPKAQKTTNSGFLVEQTTSQTKIPENRGRDQIVKYRVKEGDTLSLIAQNYSISLDTLLYVNDLNDDDIIAIGQELTVLPVSGVYYTVGAGDTVENIAEKWKVEPQAIVEINWLEKPYDLTVGQGLMLPNAEPPKPVVVVPPVYALSNSAQAYQEPVNGSGQFSTPTGGSFSRGYGWYYGYFHGAVDYANSCGAPVYAADSGYVDVAGWRAGGYGLTVWINHGNGYYSRYAHLSATSVSAGSYVSKGQLIGSIGATGLAYGCHLHFVIERNGTAIDPLSVL